MTSNSSVEGFGHMLIDFAPGGKDDSSRTLKEVCGVRNNKDEKAKKINPQGLLEIIQILSDHGHRKITLTNHFFTKIDGPCDWAAALIKLMEELFFIDRVDFKVLEKIVNDLFSKKLISEPVFVSLDSQLGFLRALSAEG